MKSRRRFALVCGFLAVTFTPYARSQATITYALLNGTITDEAGRTVVKANVTLRSLDTNQTFTAVSNDSGYYAMPSLPPGRYELAVSEPGFGTYTRTGVELTVGQAATLPRGFPHFLTVSVMSGSSNVHPRTHWTYSRTAR